MNFYKTTKTLLPFYPDNGQLRKHWWHRLALVASTIISAISATVLIAGIGDLVNQVMRISKIRQTADQIELYKAVTPERVKETIMTKKRGKALEAGYSPEEITEFEHGNLSKILFSKISAEKLGETLQDIYGSKFKQYENEELGLAVLYRYPEFRQLSYSLGDLSVNYEALYVGFGFAVVGIFGPNLIYRTLLFIFTNGSWRKSE